MKPKRTQEEIDLIRPAFNSYNQTGFLQLTVEAEINKNPNLSVDILDMTSIYIKRKCFGIVNLISFLLMDGQDVTEIGSNCIDVNGVTKKPFTHESAFSLQSIYIGNPKTKLKPLTWLYYLAKGIDNIIPEQLKYFDGFCGEIAKIEETLKQNPDNFSDHFEED